MDGLIIILIIFGIISRMNKKKKKQEEARKARADAFEQAFAGGEREIPHPPQPAEPVKKLETALKKIPEPVKKAVREEIPFTKEEWDRFLGNIEGKKPAKKPVPKERIAEQRPLAEGFSLPLKSTQGESEKEHRAHLEKIAAAEKKQREQAELAREIRSMNRQKLRQAIVMSEVLGKPVALRGRRG